MVFARMKNAESDVSLRGRECGEFGPVVLQVG